MMPTADGKIAMAMSGLNTVGRRDIAELVQLTRLLIDAAASVATNACPARPAGIIEGRQDFP
jgi:hypothetical protein